MCTIVHYGDKFVINGVKYSISTFPDEEHAVLAVESSQDNKVQLNRPVIGGNPPKTCQDGPVDKITTIT